MNLFWEKLKRVEGDPTQQVIDLILFLGYFAICLYAGGIAYSSAYNDSFQLPVNINNSYISLAITFVTKVLLNSWYLIVSIIIVLLFIFLYYSCRYIWRPAVGYFVLSLIFYMTFLACSWSGMHKGRVDASIDKLKNSTTRPAIKLYGKDIINADFASGSYVLLAEDGNKIFIFEPTGIEGSPIIWHGVLKSKIEHYEVTVK